MSDPMPQNMLPGEISAALGHVTSGGLLSEHQTQGLFTELLSGHLTDAQIVALLTALAHRGPTVDELTGAARVMRRHVTAIPTPPGLRATLIDTCGTGGAPKTLNVSTAAALVASAAAPGTVAVAKHGNRSRTGRGSAEVLAALGVNVDATPAVQSRCLAEAGVCFCFAIHHHPAMKHAAAARKSLAFPTIFNALGPMTNPAGASRQLIGVYRQDLAQTMAAALARLGAAHAMVVHGLDGLDEITTTAPTVIARVRDGAVHTSTFDARAVLGRSARLEDLAANDLDDAAARVRSILEGRQGPARDIVLVNAAAALLVADAFADWPEALAAAEHAIDSGAALRTLRTLAAVSNRP